MPLLFYTVFLHWICSIPTNLAIAVMDVSFGTPYICDYIDLPTLESRGHLNSFKQRRPLDN